MCKEGAKLIDLNGLLLSTHQSHQCSKSQQKVICVPTHHFKRWYLKRWIFACLPDLCDSDSLHVCEGTLTRPRTPIGPGGKSGTTAAHSSYRQQKKQRVKECCIRGWDVLKWKWEIKKSYSVVWVRKNVCMKHCGFFITVTKKSRFGSPVYSWHQMKYSD